MTDELKRLFGEMTEPADASIKADHIEQAKKAFRDQGSEDAVRPKEKTVSFPNQNQRQDDMQSTYPIHKQRWFYTGFASAAVLVVGVFFVVDQTTVDLTELPEAVVELRAPVDTLESRQSTAEPKKESGVLYERLPSSDVATAVPQIAAAPVVQQSSVSRDQLLRRFKVKQFPQSIAEESVGFSGHLAGQDNFSSFDTNPVQLVTENATSTFSIDVDTASYSFVRRQLLNGVLPQKASIRLEEMVNYFPYNYATPEDLSVPFKPSLTVLASPWNPENHLVHIGIKGFDKVVTEDVRTNLVFLLDVSGSMKQPDKLPLVKQSLSLLLNELHPDDTVSIVVYAGAAGAVLEPTPVREKRKILSALNRLNAGGSTAGAQGIELAYELAESVYVEGGVNRIMLATDGDFNVGMTDHDALEGLIERKRESGVYLSVLGFGQGNYQDALMQRLAQNGNGIATYIDSLSEARKVLVDEARSQLFPIANDVKIQVEFNPQTVSEYRLLGYETRALNREDFNNDQVDAGEIGAGHTVTAIYEITPVGKPGLLDESRYASGMTTDPSGRFDELGFLKIRYKRPGETTSQLISQPIVQQSAAPGSDVEFSVAVAGFAQLLKDGKYTGTWSFDDALELALANKGLDEFGYRAEFTQLVRAANLANSNANQ